jgi:hypothetical protein
MLAYALCNTTFAAHLTLTNTPLLLPCPFPCCRQGSSPEVREAAAEGLGELVVLTSEEGLKPFVVAITGPLIRIIGDRFPPETKAAILATLGLLIRRAGPGLKPFVPQLQTTFLKCLNDPVSGAARVKQAEQMVCVSAPLLEEAACVCS